MDSGYMEKLAYIIFKAEDRETAAILRDCSLRLFAFRQHSHNSLEMSLCPLLQILTGYIK